MNLTHTYWTNDQNVFMNEKEKKIKPISNDDNNNEDDDDDRISLCVYKLASLIKHPKSRLCVCVCVIVFVCVSLPGSQVIFFFYFHLSQFETNEIKKNSSLLICIYNMIICVCRGYLLLLTTTGIKWLISFLF